MWQLLIEKQGQRSRAVLLKDGRVYDYLAWQGAQLEAEQDLVYAKVRRVLKAAGAAFVTLPNGEEGFMPMLSPLKPGDMVLCQQKRVKTQQKAAYFHPHVELNGHALVYLPFAKQDKLSKKIEDAAERRRLHVLLSRVARKEGAFILHSRGQGLLLKDLKEEADALQARWQEILLSVQGRQTPMAVSMKAPPLIDFVRHLPQDTVQVLVNDAAVMAGLPLAYQEHPTPFLLYGVEEKLDKAFRRKVLLKSGAGLIIDRTEAMTVIDVNSGQSVKGKGADFLAINLEAAEEIMRLMRLRRMGGIILVDFIDMKQDGDNQALLEYLKALAKEDRVPVTVHGMTALGLVEMTRQRRENALNHGFTACSACQGTGIKRSEEETDES